MPRATASTLGELRDPRLWAAPAVLLAGLMASAWAAIFLIAQGLGSHWPPPRPRPASPQVLDPVQTSDISQPVAPTTVVTAAAPSAVAPPPALGPTKWRTGGVEWAARPGADDIERVYPSDARIAFQDGSVELDCPVVAGGLLKGCRVTSESPAGLGFGAAALKLSRLYRLRPSDPADRSVTTEVRFSVSFRAPQIIMRRPDADPGVTTSTAPAGPLVRGALPVPPAPTMAPPISAPILPPPPSDAETGRHSATPHP